MSLKNGERMKLFKSRFTYYVMVAFLIGLEPFQARATDTIDPLEAAILDVFENGGSAESIVPARSDKKFYVPDPDPVICESDNSKTAKGGVSLKNLVSELADENKIQRRNTVQVASSKKSKKKTKKTARRETRPPVGMTKASGKVVSPLPSISDATIRGKKAPGCRVHPILKRRKNHNGMDVGAPTGTTLVSVMDGEVVHAGRAGGYGNLVTIRHRLPNGKVIYSKYAHMFVGRNCKLPRVGTKVSAGQKIGCVGSTGLSTGPHLHFEIRSSASGGAVYDSKHFVLSRGELRAASSCARRR